MRRLKTYEVVMTPSDNGAWVLKSEADKVIAHNKYKRCLSMADFCESQHDYYNTLGNGFWLVMGDKEKRDEYRKKASDFWWKYHKRWLELAKKFKDKEVK